ncbi:tRNA nuclease WapA precursor [bacterium BMS3Abin07]|nr:tRNA nuclease WapA precursor [bacterium BMS3Abin07]GBE32055.1 tRNA nuclease WapA precursor [bacterium BMS3Bbin05]HDO23524.1 hypothetical protein [Nitrospirota bacterium]
MRIVNKKLKVLISWMIITAFFFAQTAIAGQKVYFYHTDPAGTPLAMSDEGGNIVWEADYKPFGEDWNVPVYPENNRTFVGKERDKETGLHYFGARYYKSEIGRFLSPDPVGPVDPQTGKLNGLILANPQRLNPYAYGLNNPYKYVDPDGRIIEVIGNEKEKEIIKRDIGKLKHKSPTANKLIKKIEQSEEIVEIKITDKGNSYDTKGNVINYNPNKNHIYSGKEQWHWRYPEIGLGHEAIHSLHDIENNMGSTREIEESKTVGLHKFSNEPYTENKIRIEYGLERRPQY